MAEPALDRAHPSGAIAGTYRPVDHVAVTVLMDDGTWDYAEAMGWAKDASGAWRIQLLRYGTDRAGHQTQLEDWWLYDPARARLTREPDDPPRPRQEAATAPQESHSRHGDDDGMGDNEQGHRGGRGDGDRKDED